MNPNLRGNSSRISRARLCWNLFKDIAEAFLKVVSYA